VRSNGATHLDEAVNAAGIASVNFFNGRLLTGEDLSREQDANREARLRLGRAVGAGVAYGFEVSESKGLTSPSSPVLRVEPGLAVNFEGAVLELGTGIDLSLVEDAAPGGPAPTALFTDCPNGAMGGYVAGFGVYLLAVSPSETRQGRAPTSGLANVDASCNSDLFLEGVSFHLVPVPLASGEVSTLELLRNHLAARAFGIDPDVRAVFDANPFGPSPTPYGLVAQLLDGCLTTADVPLALLAWTASGGILFIDMWSVRRRVVAPAADDRWPLLVGDRLRGDSEAMFLEFEEHVGDLTLSIDPSTVPAGKFFEYLPPVGILPVILPPDSPLGQPQSPAGFDPTTFFGAQASSSVEVMDERNLLTLVQESFWHEPIHVGSDTRIQLYYPYSNYVAVTNGQSSQLSLVFASETLPYRGRARFDFAYFGTSRFASRVT
jgi:hypothetical protein